MSTLWAKRHNYDYEKLLISGAKSLKFTKISISKAKLIYIAILPPFQVTFLILLFALIHLVKQE